MPKLIIDNHPIHVPEGTKIIDAAEQLGIIIPRFCYHPALGSVGACRVCAVKVENAGRLSGIQMSCMIDALDGMVVKTDDPEAVAFRRQVIEWLMINHPHDCPVCDEGGHCLLQDLTISGGHGIRRFKGKKRTYTDQYLGPLIQHEMNRCIQCYRCSRFYQDYAGYRDLGAMGIAGRVYFGRFSDGVLESPFAGNLIDICPTGVYTDKPSRYTGRRWDFERSPGICIHCSLGCHTTVSARYRRIVRQEARLSETVNGHFICDRGRYGFYYESRPDRPRKGRVDERTVPPAEAASAAVTRLDAIADTYGPSAVAVAGSERCSLETQFALKTLCREKGWQPPMFFPDKARAQSVRTAAASLTPELALSLKEIEAADSILAIGTDVLNEAPMAALALRQARRKGAFVAAMDFRHLAWPFDFFHLPVHPAAMETAVLWLKQAVAGEDSQTGPPSELPESLLAHLEEIVSAFSKSRRPVIVCGTETGDAGVLQQAAELAAALQNAERSPGLFPLLPGANSYGAAFLDDAGKSLEHLMEWTRSGVIKALLTVETETSALFHDKPALEEALSELTLRVAMDYINTDETEQAHVHVPTQTVFESGGIFVNQEGRAQRAQPAHAGGIPIDRTGGGDHPPRIFQPDIPGGDVPAAWQLLAGWRPGGGPDAAARLMKELTAAFPVLAEMTESGVRMPAAGEPAHISQKPSQGGPGEDFRLFATAPMFGGESLSCRSDCLQGLQSAPFLWMSETDAESLALSDGDPLLLSLRHQPVELVARLSRQMPAGVMTLPRLHSIFWQQLDAPRSTWISGRQIQRIRQDRREA